MLSILYLKKDESLEIVQQTVQRHAEAYSTPFFVIDLAAFSETVKTLTTPYVMIATPNTYLHLRNLLFLLQTDQEKYDCYGHHFDQTTRTIDLDCGFLVKTSRIAGFQPTDFTSFPTEFTRQLASHPDIQLNIRAGFNKLNFEASYMHTHHCERCITSFQSGIVFTLGNMSDSDMVRYHAILERERQGKGVTMAIALMIKDEEEKIQETMTYYQNASYFPEIYILDTGSTDKTLERVREWQEAHPATQVIITETPFVDFSATRNVVLDQIYRESKCDYAMSTDCNDEMKGQDECFKILQQYVHFPIIFIDQVWKSPNTDPITFSNIRIVKNNGQYRWRYRVHEVLVNIHDQNGTSPSVPPMIAKLPPSVHLYQFRDQEYEIVKSARYHRDLKYFLEDYAATPTDRRIVYYLAQTYFFTQDYENAIIYCKERIALNAPEEKDEEAYHSIMRICRCMMILKRPTHQIKKWLWRAWDYYPCGKKDIEPLCFLANFYEQDKDYDTAYRIYSLCCDTARPQHNLPVRNELYTFERHKKIAEMLYHKKKFEKIYPAYAQVLKEGTPDQRQTIEGLLSLYYPSYHYPTRPVIVLYGGFFYDRKWNGKMFFEKTISLGGSETMVIRLAHLLTTINKAWNVYVFTNTDEEVTYQGVTYLSLGRYNDFMAINRVAHLILSRDASKVPENRTGKTHLWLHDLSHVGDLRDEKMYTNIVTLSPFHRTFYETQVLGANLQRKALSKKIRIIPNMIPTITGSSKELVKVSRAAKTGQWRFIYSSCPTRGLATVVKEWPAIVERYPAAELWLYCDFQNDYVRQQIPHLAQFLMEIERLPNVRLVGRVPEEQFMEECKKANIWYYPTDFKETFCITAVQMMQSGVIPLFRATGALPSLIEDAGLVVDETHPVLDRMKELEREETRNVLMRHGLEKARRYSTEVVKMSWESLLA